MKVIIWVPGIPAPGGSKRGFLHKSTGRVIVTEDCKRSKDWRTSVAWCASEAIKEPFAGPVTVEVEFRMPRPKGHFWTGRNQGRLRAGAPHYHITKPDCTKLWRSTEDALKGIAWIDDSQVVRQVIKKVYWPTPGAEIRIEAEAIGVRM